MENQLDIMEKILFMAVILFLSMAITAQINKDTVFVKNFNNHTYTITIKKDTSSLEYKQQKAELFYYIKNMYIRDSIRMRRRYYKETSYIDTVPKENLDTVWGLLRIWNGIDIDSTTYHGTGRLIHSWAKRNDEYIWNGYLFIADKDSIEINLTFKKGYIFIQGKKPNL